MRLRHVLPLLAPLALPALPARAADVPMPDAAGKAAQAQQNQAAGKTADPVVARVGDAEIHLSAVRASTQSLPAELRAMPLQMLYPMLLGQAVDREALTLQARKQKLEDDPRVQAAMRRARDEVLQDALLSREVGPTITEDAIRARYDADYKNKPGEPEVHARHILLPTEDAARKAIAQLKAGAKFDDLAKKLSTDPGAQNGGDLGWFKRGDMVPAFSDAAFAMKPGEISQAPVHTQFGWHVIKVEETRTSPAQSYEAVHDQIRQKLISEGVKKAVAEARQGLKIQEFMPDGQPLPAEASALAAPAPAPPPTPNEAGHAAAQADAAVHLAPEASPGTTVAATPGATSGATPAKGAPTPPGAVGAPPVKPAP